MRRSLIGTLLATIACCGVFGAGQADAIEYVNHVGIGSGANYFGPFVSLYAAETIGYGQGIGCAGIRGISGVVCEPEPGAPAAIVPSNHLSSEPDIHHHATFISDLN